MLVAGQCVEWERLHNHHHSLLLSVQFDQVLWIPNSLFWDSGRGNQQNVSPLQASDCHGHFSSFDAPHCFIFHQRNAIIAAKKWQKLKQWGLLSKMSFRVVEKLKNIVYLFIYIKSDLFKYLPTYLCQHSGGPHGSHAPAEQSPLRHRQPRDQHPRRGWVQSSSSIVELI